MFDKSADKLTLYEIDGKHHRWKDSEDFSLLYVPLVVYKDWLMCDDFGWLGNGNDVEA